MWRCAKCETINSNEFCSVCGSPKPKEQQQQRVNQEQNTKQQNQNMTPATNAVVEERIPATSGREAGVDFVKPEKKNKNGVLIAVLMILLVIAVTVATFAVVKLANNNPEVAKETDYTSGETVVDGTQDNAEGEESVSAEKVQTKDETEGSDATPTEKETNVVAADDETVETNADPDENSTEKTDSTPAEATYPEEGGYHFYRNDAYGFYCAYPASFEQVGTNGMNAVQKYASRDRNTVMTIRAVENTRRIGAKEALAEFLATYSGEVTYKANGDTWYAISMTKSDGRLHYRKLFMKNDNIYCMDFEMNEDEVEKYRADVEYIEDNFKAY